LKPPETSGGFLFSGCYKVVIARNAERKLKATQGNFVKRVT